MRIQKGLKGLCEMIGFTCIKGFALCSTEGHDVHCAHGRIRILALTDRDVNLKIALAC